VGGVLTSIYAQSRFTQDIDLVVKLEISDKSKSQLLQIFQKYNFQPFTDWDGAFYQWTQSHFIQFLDPSGLVKIDFSIWFSNLESLDIYEKLKKITFTNRIRTNLFGIDCWIQTKENFILSKLVFGGYQDYKDALACKIRFGNNIDFEYLQKYSKIFSIEEVLSALLDEIPVDEVFPDD
jgi:hypothetical protein